MARLPLPARFARMLLFANQQGLMPYAVALVAALSVPDFFLLDTSTPQAEDTNEKNEEGGSAAPKKKKQDKKGGDDSERLAQQRTKFLQQFVNTVNALVCITPLRLSQCPFESCSLNRFDELVGSLSPSNHHPYRFQMCLLICETRVPNRYLPGGSSFN